MKRPLLCSILLQVHFPFVNKNDFELNKPIGCVRKGTITSSANLGLVWTETIWNSSFVMLPPKTWYLLRSCLRSSQETSAFSFYLLISWWYECLPGKQKTTEQSTFVYSWISFSSVIRYLFVISKRASAHKLIKVSSSLYVLSTRTIL